MFAQPFEKCFLLLAYQMNRQLHDSFAFIKFWKPATNYWALSVKQTRQADPQAIKENVVRKMSLFHVIFYNRF